MSKDFLVINEVFGPTFQGEGKSIGMPCYFVRLSGCNQACVFCDTPYTWDWTGKNGVKYDPHTEAHKRSIQDVIERLMLLDNHHITGEKSIPVRSLVVSGGEPMLQQEGLKRLVYQLKQNRWWVEVETAGTIAPVSDMYVDQFNVSIKLRSSGNPIDVRHKRPAIEAFVRDTRSNFKFVVVELKDYEEIDYLVSTYHIAADRVYIMPEGIDVITVQNRSRLIADEALYRGYKLTTRLQILLHGNKRGV